MVASNFTKAEQASLDKHEHKRKALCLIDASCWSMVELGENPWLQWVFAQDLAWGAVLMRDILQRHRVLGLFDAC